MATLAGVRDAYASGGGGVWAGFGNKTNDARAYLSAGVPPERIWLINPQSEIREAPPLAVSGVPKAPTPPPPPPRETDAAPLVLADAAADATAAPQTVYAAYSEMVRSVGLIFPLRCPEQRMTEVRAPSFGSDCSPRRVL